MIVVKNRTMVIPKIERTLGTFQDTNTETRLFKIDRFTEGTADISHLLFKLISRNENGVENPIHLEKAVTEDAIYLTWQVLSNDIGVSGTLLCQIQGFDDQGVCRWNSFIGAFYVEQNLGGDIDPEHLSDYEALQLRLEKGLQEIENANYMKAEDLPIASKDIAGMVKIGYGLAVDPDGTVYVVVSGGDGSGVSSYLALTDKPEINGVVLSGAKTLEELGIQPAGDYLTPDNAPVGGYYIPHVLEDGTLAWTKTKEDMEDVAGANIKGPAGEPGATGKTAFEYAADGGYEGTEEEFAAKLAEEAILAKDTVSSYEDLENVTETGKWLDAKAAKDGFDAHAQRISDVETSFQAGCEAFEEDLLTAYNITIDAGVAGPDGIIAAYKQAIEENSGYNSLTLACGLMGYINNRYPATANTDYVTKNSDTEYVATKDFDAVFLSDFGIRDSGSGTYKLYAKVNGTDVLSHSGSSSAKLNAKTVVYSIKTGDVITFSITSVSNSSGSVKCYAFERASEEQA